MKERTTNLPSAPRRARLSCQCGAEREVSASSMAGVVDAIASAGWDLDPERYAGGARVAAKCPACLAKQPVAGTNRIHDKGGEPGGAEIEERTAQDTQSDPDRTAGEKPDGRSDSRDRVGPSGQYRARRDDGGDASAGLTAEPFYGPLPFHHRTYRGGGCDSSGGARAFVIADGVERRLRLKQGEDLARAILRDFLGFDPHPQVYQEFHRQTIAGLPRDGWTLTPAELRQALRTIGARLKISCLRCLDRHVLFQGSAIEAPCPVCRDDVGRREPLSVEDL
jgi:hypothetical protein